MKPAEDFQPDEDFEPDAPADKVAPGGLTGVITGKPATSKAESFGRGALQGASLGFGDEISAAIDAGISHIPIARDIAQKIAGTDTGGGLPVNDPNLTYQQRRDAYRTKNTEAQQSNPWTYAGGTLAGGAATAGALPFKGPLAAPAFAGGLYGAGASDAPLGVGTAVDAGIGAGTGLLLGGAIHGAKNFVEALTPTAALERNVATGLENVGEKVSKKTRVKLDTPGVETVVREDPAIRAAAVKGDDSALKQTVDTARAQAIGKLREIYSSAPQEVSPANAIANMDAKIAELKAGTHEKRQIGAELEKIRNEFQQANGGQTAITPARLRAEQSDYQKLAYAKALSPAEQTTTAAYDEAQRAVGDSVMKHVTGMGYAEAKAAAAKDPTGLAAQLFKANETVSSLNRIDAGITDRASRVQPKESTSGHLIEVGKHIAHSPVGFGLAQAPNLAARGVRAIDARLENATLPGTETLAKFVAAAKAGNPFAARVISGLASTAEGRAKIAATNTAAGMAVGAVGQ